MKTVVLLRRALVAPVALVALAYAPPLQSFMKAGLYHVDTLFHFAGGALAADACSVWLRARAPWWRNVPLVARIVVMVGCSLIVGMAWEWYEFLSDLYLGTHHQLSLADTMKDLALDALGGMIYGIFFARK